VSGVAPYCSISIRFDTPSYQIVVKHLPGYHSAGLLALPLPSGRRLETQAGSLEGGEPGIAAELMQRSCLKER
jgi:hypothetical protein